MSENKSYSAKFAVYQSRPWQEALLLNRAEGIFPDYTVGKDGLKPLLIDGLTP